MINGRDVKGRLNSFSFQPQTPTSVGVSEDADAIDAENLISEL